MTHVTISLPEGFGENIKKAISYHMPCDSSFKLNAGMEVRADEQYELFLFMREVRLNGTINAPDAVLEFEAVMQPIGFAVTSFTITGTKFLGRKVILTA